jgi:hypothetical protein
MTPTNFYNLPALFTTKDLTWFFNYDAFPELLFPSVPNPNSLHPFQIQDRVDLRVVKFRTLNKSSIAERQVWVLASLWFDGVPCAILRNPYEREGSYYPLRYVTDPETHKEMTRYLAGQVKKEVHDATNRVDELFVEMVAGWQPTVVEIPYPPLTYVENAIDELL